MFCGELVQEIHRLSIACFLDTSPINPLGCKGQSCAGAGAQKPEAPGSLPQNPRTFHFKYLMVVGTTESGDLEIFVVIQEFLGSSAQTLQW